MFGSAGSIHVAALNGAELRIVRDGMEHELRRAFKQVRHPHIEFALAQADGVVDRDEGIETNVHRRNGRPGSQVTVSRLEDF